jgi:penicillin-binding protein 1A
LWRISLIPGQLCGGSGLAPDFIVTSQHLEPGPGRGPLEVDRRAFLRRPPSAGGFPAHPSLAPGNGNRLLAWLGISLIVGGVTLAVATVAWERCLFQACPDVRRLASYQPGGGLVLLDRNGQKIEDIMPVEGVVVRLASLPPHVSEAFIAVEDRRFRDHGGVDWVRVAGALWTDIRAGKAVEGSSTITMQLARNLFPDRIRAQERTLSRKLLEVRSALHIEKEFTKDEILELYLNHIYFGGGARGVEAAARHYFGVSAANLSLPEAALLAALPKAPGRYDPRRNPNEARERRNLVLTLMEAQGRLSPHHAEAGRSSDLAVTPQPPAKAASIAPYFVEMVRRELEKRLGPRLYDEPLKITTTLDRGAQTAAEEELARQLEKVEKGTFGRFRGSRYSASDPPPEGSTPYLQGAVVALEVASGDVLAWVGGRDFRHSRFDRVNASRRQAGSAFKPFVYGAALEAGRTLSQALVDEPLEVRLDEKEVWSPRNFDGGFEGLVSMREALVRSKNIPTVRLAQDVGIGAVVEFAQRAGIEPPIPEEPSMPLGTVELSLEELTSAYSAFAGLGQGVEPRFILRVERSNGEPVWSAPAPQRRAVVEPGVAYLVNDVLREALGRGPGASVRQGGFNAPAAGKTGTTNEGADAWFVGYTSEVVAGVWVGFDERRPIVRSATGGRLAAPVWTRMMLRYYERRPRPAPWKRPSDVLEGMIDSATGFLLLSGCEATGGHAYRELLLRGHEPAAVCPYQAEPWLSQPVVFVEPEAPDSGVRSYTPNPRVHRDEGELPGESPPPKPPTSRLPPPHP